MKLKEKILNGELLKEAMVSKDTIKLSVVRFLKSEIQRFEGGKSEMSEVQLINLIKKNIESSKSNIDISIKNKDFDSVSIMEEEIKILETFLPTQLTEVEVSNIIDEIIVSGATNIGLIMGTFTKNYGGRADAKMVSNIVKEKLN